MKIEIDVDQLRNEIAQEVVTMLKPLLRPRSQEDKIMGVKELAGYLDQKPSWVYAHISEIPHTKKGGLLMFKKSTIDKWLEPDYYPVPQDIKFLRKGGVA